MLWGRVRTPGKKLGFLWRNKSWREQDFEGVVKEPKCPKRRGSS